LQGYNNIIGKFFGKCYNLATFKTIILKYNILTDAEKIQISEISEKINEIIKDTLKNGVNFKNFIEIGKLIVKKDLSKENLLNLLNLSPSYFIKEELNLLFNDAKLTDVENSLNFEKTCMKKLNLNFSEIKELSLLDSEESYLTLKELIELNNERIKDSMKIETENKAIELLTLQGYKIEKIINLDGIKPTKKDKVNKTVTVE